MQLEIYMGKTAGQNFESDGPKYTIGTKMSFNSWYWFSNTSNLHNSMEIRPQVLTVE